MFSQLNCKQNIVLNERKQLIKSILDPLFTKIHGKDISDTEKTALNLSYANGISFDAAQRYTDNQYFIDVTFLNDIQIKNLFFDGRKCEIGGFGTDGKPLTLGLVKLLSENIHQLLQDYNGWDFINDINRKRFG
jgi:hypothetical protein